MFLNNAENEKKRKNDRNTPTQVYMFALSGFMYSVPTLSRPDLPQQPWKHAYVLFPNDYQDDDEPSLHDERRTKTLSAVM